MNRLSSDREKDRAEYVFALLVSEREQLSLCDELMEARQDIARLHGKISELQTRLRASIVSTSIYWRCLSARAFFIEEAPY